MFDYNPQTKEVTAEKLSKKKKTYGQQITMKEVFIAKFCEQRSSHRKYC